MAVHVGQERLLPGVGDLHGAARAQREQAGVHLHGQVLAGAERPARPRRDEPHLRGLEGQAGGDLVAVGVQPLRGDVQVDAAVGPRHREPALGPERRLVLGADRVLAADHDLGLVRVGVHVAVQDGQVAQDVAARVQEGGGRIAGPLGIAEHGQRLVLHPDEAGRGPRSGQVVRGDDGHRPRRGSARGPRRARAGRAARGRTWGARDVLVGEDAADAVERLRGRGVDRQDPGVGMRGSRGGAEQHPVAAQIGGVREGALDLGRPVGAARARADAVPDGPGSERRAVQDAHRASSSAARSAARSTASTIFW
jgi:hypothetical protein